MAWLMTQKSDLRHSFFLLNKQGLDHCLLSKK